MPRFSPRLTNEDPWNIPEQLMSLAEDYRRGADWCEREADAAEHIADRREYGSEADAFRMAASEVDNVRRRLEAAFGTTAKASEDRP